MDLLFCGQTKSAVARTAIEAYLDQASGTPGRPSAFDLMRDHIGTVLQDTTLFAASVKENIAFGRPDASMADIIEAAKAARAHDFIQELPGKYDSYVGERGVTLSGGQKQRLSIARAILKNPEILILDDATSSVDSETESLIQAALGRLMEGRTSFVIAHRVQTVIRADRILVLEGGRIIQTGTHDELLKVDGFYRKIFDLQFDELSREE